MLILFLQSLHWSGGEGGWILIDICFVSYFFKNSSFFEIFFFKFRWSPLHRAAKNGFEQIVKLLIEHGANVNLQNHVFSFFFGFVYICYLDFGEHFF